MKTNQFRVGDQSCNYIDIDAFAQSEGVDISRLPVSIKILLENLLRNMDSPAVDMEDARAVLRWTGAKKEARGVAWHPARVVMQDFTGVPAVVDLAAMRDALDAVGADVRKINPQIPVDLVIDHSVMVDNFGSDTAFSLNVMLEFKRNQERYRFLKWGQKAFDNFRVVPPGTGIIHQVNLEYLAKVVWTSGESEPLVYPDTVVGTDSHTTMINGLSVLGWGVGGIEAEAAMLGQPITMLIPEVVGFKLDGHLPPGRTATDLVLTVVNMLRAKGVVGKFVEFYGSGLSDLSLADRATISNMAPEYGATCGFFPIDDELLAYLRLTGRDEAQVQLVEQYARIQGLWRNDAIRADYSDTLQLDMGDVRSSLAGPRRPQDLLALGDTPGNFRSSLNTVFGVNSQDTEVQVPVDGMDHQLRHGDIAIAAITSCTNTSNPAVLIAAALVAKKAHSRGLHSKPWVKTSFAPGSQVVSAYLEKAGLREALEAQGFHLVGYGCTTCIGNSGPLPPEIKKAIQKGNLVTVNVLSGNRNFEGRVSPDSKASYLASPPLVVAYALAGSIFVNVEKDSLGNDSEGNPVYLKDIWPSQKEISDAIAAHLSPELFKTIYADVFSGERQWQDLRAPEGDLYDWEEESSYIRRPPFFNTSEKKQVRKNISGARALAILPDSTTTDHISPAGNIPDDGPAGRYLQSLGVAAADFNSFGSRRGNHEVMMRGTFANIRIKNSMLPGVEGGYTRGPDGEVSSIYDAAMAWAKQGVPLIILAGKEYGTGSSRDWAGKGPALLGVSAVIAQSYERIHRSNLIGMGVLPLEFTDETSLAALDGSETFSINGLEELRAQDILNVTVSGNTSVTQISVRCRIDTAVEMSYWRSGGILNYVLGNLQKEK